MSVTVHASERRQSRSLPGADDPSPHPVPDVATAGARSAVSEPATAAEVAPPVEDDTRVCFVTQLVEEHGNAMMGYAIRLTGDRYLAEDVVQETLVRAWQRRHLLHQERGSVRGWLLTVLRNQIIDRSRARDVRPPEVAEPEDRELLGVAIDMSDRVVTAVTVTEAVAQLSEEHRRVLFELYFRDRSVGQVAAELGVPPGTVKSRTFYALRQLRVLLAEPPG